MMETDKRKKPTRKESIIGHNITWLLKRDNKSQSELANHINVKPRQVSRWILDGVAPNSNTLVLIADYFRINLDVLTSVKLGDDIENDDHWDSLEKSINAINQANIRRSIFDEYIKSIGVQIEYGEHRQYETHPATVTLTWTVPGTSIKKSTTYTYNEYKRLADVLGKRLIVELNYINE